MLLLRASVANVDSRVHHPENDTTEEYRQIQEELGSALAALGQRLDADLVVGTAAASEA